MSARRDLAKGFTLIELMIVVAIIGVLAAVAIPNFLKYQLRAKFGELPFNVNALYKAEESARQSERPVTAGGVTTTGQYVSTGKLPAACVAGTAKNVWQATDLAVASGIDWAVEGSTYACYEALASSGGAALTVAAESDLDGDSSKGCLALFQPLVDDSSGTTTMTAPAPTATVCGGVAGYVASAPYGAPRRFPDDSTF